MAKISDIKSKTFSRRERLFFTEHESGKNDATLRIRALRQYAKKHSDKEASSHLIVASIAALEMFFRGFVAETLNHSQKYRLRAGKLLADVKINLGDATEFLDERRFTFGDAVAALIPFSKLGHVSSCIEGLLNEKDEKCEEILATTVDHFQFRDNAPLAELTIKDVNCLLKCLSRGFYLRHILAHEAAINVLIKHEEAIEILESVALLMKAMEDIMWNRVFIDIPITAIELETVSIADLRRAKDLLSRTIRTARIKIRDNDKLRRFNKNHLDWKKNNKEWYRQSFCAQNDNMSRSLGTIDLAESIERRSASIELWLKYS